MLKRKIILQMNCELMGSKKLGIPNIVRLMTQKQFVANANANPSLDFG